MAVGKQGSGPLWAVGQFTLRVRGPGTTPGRVVRIRKPFALIGRHPDADVWIDDPSVEDRHVVLLLDRRGLFGVDLLSASGTRFAGALAGSSWLSLGDLLEVAGRRIELVQIRVDGQAIDPPLSDDDPLSGIDDNSLVPLSLELIESAAPPWMIGSALAFLGGGDACAIKVENGSATNCALLRYHENAYVINLISDQTLINDAVVEGASALLDGDILTVGGSRFVVRIGHESISRSENRPSTLAVLPNASTSIISDPRETLRAWLVEAVAEGLGSPHEQVLALLREFQLETSSLLEVQFARIEALHREIADLRAVVQGRHPGPNCPEPAPPLRMDLLPEAPSTPSEQSSTWLLERLGGLEQESRSTWRDLLGKITSTVGPRVQTPEPGGRLVSTRSSPRNLGPD